MSNSLDDLLSTPLEQIDNIVVSRDGSVREKTHSEKKQEAKKLGYVKIPGVINLSYSRSAVLHSCPRKFFLREVAATEVTRTDTVHTAFGSTFGAGIQELLRTGSLERALLFAFCHWNIAINEEDYRSNKSVWSALKGIEVFYEQFYPEFIASGYELAYLGDKPGIEIHYLVWFKEGYNHQGHIDLVLIDRNKNELVVLEIKTTSKTPHPADWANSEQTLGYSVVLDAIAKEYGISSGYRVEYLIYNPAPKLSGPAENFGFTNYSFGKGGELKAEYLLDSLMDINMIEIYLANSFFPKRGNNCFSWYRVCDYFGRCDELMEQYKDRSLVDIHTESLDADAAYESMELKDVDFVSDFDTIMAAQENRTGKAEVDKTQVVKDILS